MRIGIIGAGKVARAVGQVWSGSHGVAYGVRDPGSPRYADLLAAGSVCTPADAARDADVILLATPWNAAIAAVEALGDLGGRPLIDATNPVRFGGPIVERALDGAESAAERIQQAAPSARVVKAFNHYGLEVLGGAARFPQRPLMLLAGDLEPAKSIVASAIADAGFHPHDAGPLMAARLLEDLARLWMTIAPQASLHRDFAFSLLAPTRSDV